MPHLKRSGESMRAKRGSLFAVLVCSALATNASAGLYRFNNTAPDQPDYFDWGASPWLDITLDRHQQSGIDNGVSSFKHAAGLNQGVVHGNSGSAELEVEDHLLAPTPGAQLIPSGASFAEFGFSLLDDASLLPEGETEYLGVRIMLSDWHYGWIGVIRDGNELSAFAWAYESEPNVPAQAGQLIPEPATLLVCLLGSVVLFVRRPRLLVPSRGAQKSSRLS